LWEHQILWDNQICEHWDWSLDQLVDETSSGFWQKKIYARSEGSVPERKAVAFPVELTLYGQC